MLQTRNKIFWTHLLPKEKVVWACSIQFRAFSCHQTPLNLLKPSGFFTYHQV
jgi:hypothetical protein